MSHPNAVLASDFSLEPFVYYMWWCFLPPPFYHFGGAFRPPLYDFDGAFCHHFLCSDFTVILFKFQISKNGGCKMEPFLNSGGAFRPQIVKVGALSAPTQKILLKYSLDLPYKLEFYGLSDFLFTVVLSFHFSSCLNLS